MGPIKVLGISGSLRQGSHNAAVLSAARALLPEGMSLNICERLVLPLYDVNGESDGFPSEVQAFRARVATADAILFACPEYNYAIPAALKNALEWASRPPNPPFAAKACAIFGATTSPLGTMRAQTNLRQICVSLNLLAVNTPQLDIPLAPQKFNADGDLVDNATRETMRALLVALYELASKLKPL